MAIINTQPDENDKWRTFLVFLFFLQLSDWKDILIILKSNGEISVRIASKTVATAQSTYNIDEFKEYYIGGAPQDLREKYVVIIFPPNHYVLQVRWSAFSRIPGFSVCLHRYNITIGPFKGCMSNLKQQRDFKSIDEQVGISKGCPVDSLVRHELFACQTSYELVLYNQVAVQTTF